MASRCLGELMLRPSSLVRTPHAPVTTQTWPRICHRGFAYSPNRPAQSSSNDNNGENYIADRGSKRPQIRFIKEGSAAEPQPRSQAQPQSTQDDTTRTIDSLFSGMPTNRAPPRYMPKNAAPASQANRVFGAEFSNANRSRPSLRPPGLAFDSMALPDSMLNPNLSNKPSDASNLAVQQEQTFSSYPRLNPTYGRTVELDASRGRDIVRGIGMLGSLMARNKVKTDFNRQRFHERGGLKRKRLASERWRARFKQGFKEVTGRVTQLTRKGW
jgi:small subunit ribosomal protein MRP21